MFTCIPMDNINAGEDAEKPFIYASLVETQNGLATLENHLAIKI